MIGLGLGLNKYRFMGGGIPENTVRPLISNITNPSNNPAAVGDDLFVSDGTWVGAAPITFAYQWYRNGVPIVGATADTYTLVTADENKTIKELYQKNPLSNPTSEKSFFIETTCKP